MAWIPVLFVCLMGVCEFLAGDASWSLAKCEQEMIAAAKHLEELGAVVAGICIDIRVT